ncbi:hypothetical protein GP486_006224 [Trichoglossum hirsutum]|uniref:Uncharacterized protein n=1 Tax=Trichoglossum hirsutum TaxID=265104 RepID=A0A9P8L7K2_9PEZI|nr:hypothetical protein GP486_006224 [Trichoglossum hirsutum]
MPENNSNPSSRTDRVATIPEMNRRSRSTSLAAAVHLKRDNFCSDDTAELEQDGHYPDQGGDRSRRAGAQNIPPTPSVVMEPPDRGDIEMPTVSGETYLAPPQPIPNCTGAPLTARAGPCRHITTDNWGNETDKAAEGRDTEGRADDHGRRLSTSMDVQFLHGVYPNAVQRESSSVGSVDCPRLDLQEGVSPDRRLSYAGLDPDLIRCRVCRGPCGTFCRRVQANRGN